MNSMVSTICRCGSDATQDDGLCDRCRYYNSVFIPERVMFESKKELALKAIGLRKLMRGKDRIVVT